MEKVTLALTLVAGTSAVLWLREAGNARIAAVRRDQVHDNEDGTYTMFVSLAREKGFHIPSAPVTHAGLDVSPVSQADKKASE